MMTTARGRLAVLAAFSLAGMAALVPAAPAGPPAPPAPKAATAAVDGDERPAPQSIFAGTGIGVVLEANGNEVPKSGEQMMKVLEKIGDFAQLPVTFSAVDLQSGLQKPRVIITQRPSTVVPRPEKPEKQRDNPPRTPDSNTSDPDKPAGVDRPPVQTVLSTGPLTKATLEGRLFLAANFEPKNGKLKVKTFEFISWNTRRQKFDFGFIECDDVEPQIRVVDGVKCFSCHKSKGPILGQGPWSNTTHNDVIRKALTGALPDGAQAPFTLDDSFGQPRRLDTGFFKAPLEKGVAESVTADGIHVIIPQGPAVDASVRIGANMARDGEVYRTMARFQDGRRALVVLFGAIAAPGPLEQNDRAVRAALNRTFLLNYSDFADRWVTIQKNGTDTLADFNPAGSQGVLKQVATGSAGGWGSGSTLQTKLRIVWSGESEQIIEYDAQRAAGEHGLPSTRQPSNPRAFVRTAVAVPVQPSHAVNALGLARLIGLTEEDRTFLADQLRRAARKLENASVTPETLAKEVFDGPQFSSLLLAGEIPDREDFKDRFVRGLNGALKTRGGAALELTRADYASGPNVAREPGRENNEIPVVPTTACFRCHDAQKTDKAVFNPIPALAFDPFDKDGREAWVRATGAKKRVPVLLRFQKRLVGDADMPPEDSAEYDTFRAKKAADFDAVKNWLDAELKKAKGD